MTDLSDPGVQMGRHHGKDHPLTENRKYVPGTWDLRRIPGQTTLNPEAQPSG